MLPLLPVPLPLPLALELLVMSMLVPLWVSAFGPVGVLGDDEGGTESLPFNGAGDKRKTDGLGLVLLSLRILVIDRA